MRLTTLTLAGAMALVAAAPFVPTLAQTAITAADTKFVTQQPANEWLARVFLGQAVHNTTGEIVGWPAPRSGAMF